VDLYLVQQAVQQMHNKSSTTNRKLYNKSATFHKIPQLVVQQIHNKCLTILLHFVSTNSVYRIHGIATKYAGSRGEFSHSALNVRTETA